MTGRPRSATGGGAALVSLGGVSDVTNQSLAYGVDYAFSSNLLADFRFGFFRYNVNVLPFDYGTTPAKDAGIPGLNNDTTFTSGLPYGNVEGPVGGFRFGSGLDVNHCNCPLDQDEKQFQLVGNVTKLVRSHNFKFGIDVRRAYNLRVPSDSHRSGQLTFSTNRTSLQGSGGLGLATFLIGDVTNSADTSARTRTRASASGGTSTTRRTRGAQCEGHAELRSATRRHQPADAQRGRETAGSSIYNR